MAPHKNIANELAAPQQPPRMGPNLHETQARPLYDDVIFRIANKNDDGTVRAAGTGAAMRGKSHGRGHAWGCGGSHGCGGSGGGIQPQLPTEVSEEWLHCRREKQWGDRLA
ncbi:hypothetical protein K439DRAFT_1623901 [Ramaria rubella]|nr:hypothetical protein K439DRAFT_1623901 [Ramaria rubella]